MNTETNISPELFVKMVLTAWQLQNTRANELMDQFSDEDLMKETAPGRNTGIYLFGHLAAVNDGICTILGLGERLHPELDEIFVDNPISQAGKCLLLKHSNTIGKRSILPLQINSMPCSLVIGFKNIILYRRKILQKNRIVINSM
jgi:hypothetical protein